METGGAASPWVPTSAGPSPSTVDVGPVATAVATAVGCAVAQPRMVLLIGALALASGCAAFGGRALRSAIVPAAVAAALGSVLAAHAWSGLVPPPVHRFDGRVTLVTDPETFRMLRDGCRTVWLKARPEEHMSRVMAQGDLRPFKGRAAAIDDLRRLLADRERLYALADATLDTSGRTAKAALEELKTKVKP